MYQRRAQEQVRNEQKRFDDANNRLMTVTPAEHAEALRELEATKEALRQTVERSDALTRR